ncbi:LysR family transcriptional regulator [Mycobacterium sp. 1245852.3]|uniref:LysR family transcriptional regulator n=1 Tax=Mycobacterium sp. 1245852.3 TaxID=1856860 RepID=UPI0007FED563|nr:LysR family transcriptional regulator [Mycobacterium sp. 1245852.3]OBJ83295.1 hypothetical protein A9W96_27920 [Mycobacterium sp. 1245852.3]
MELRQMRSFLAVAEERNFTRAATRLNMAQSPVSQQIRRLEREIGVELFTRTTRTVALTCAGEVLYERVARVQCLIDEAVEASRKAARGHLGHLSVGFTSSGAHELLPSLVRTYAAEYPDVTLDVQGDLTTPAQVEQLLNGRLDVGVLRGPLSVQGLAVETIREEPVVVMLADSHPKASERHIELRDLRDEWFISLPSDPPATMYAIMFNACHSAGFIPKIRQTVSDTAAMVALVAGNMGVALMPDSLRHYAFKGATFRPLLTTPEITVSLAVAYRATDVTPLIGQFMKTVRSVVHCLT